MKFIKHTPLTLVAVWTFVLSRFYIIRFLGPHISDMYYYHQIADLAFQSGQRAYHDFLWSYPPLSLIFIYIPYFFRHDFEGFRLIFQILSFFTDCAMVFFMAKFMVERLRLSAKAVTIGVCSYSFFGLFQGHLIYERIDLLMVATFVVSLYYLSDPVVSKAMGAGVIGVLWKVMPVFWMPVLGLMQWYQFGKGAFARAVLVAVVPGVLFLLVWDGYVNGHMFSMLNMHAERGIQIESFWASIFMVYKVLNPSAAIEIANNNGAQHLAGADLPEWVVTLSKYFGFVVMGIFYAHFWRRIVKIKNSRRAKSFNVYIGGFLAMSVPFILFVATQRVLSTQYMQWSLPALGILLALRPRIVDFVMVTLMYAATSIEFDGITVAGHAYGYWDYVHFDPFVTYDMAFRNLLLIVFAVRFTLLYRDYFSDEPKYFGSLT